MTLLLALVMLLAWTTQAIAGFGSTLLALTLGGHLVPLPELVPVVVALNLPLSGGLAWRSRDAVDRRLLLRDILPLMSVGVLAGLVLAPWLGGPAFRRCFGVLVVGVALHNLRLAWRGTRSRTPTDVGRRSLLVGSGLTHGLWASGGPLLVMALGERERQAFRATLLAVWTLWSVVLLVSFAVRGQLDLQALGRVALLLPTVPVGVLLGERLHRVLPERGFRLFVYAVLLLAGGALLG